MHHKPKKLTQVGVNQIRPPMTGRDDYPDLVVPGLVLRVSHSGLKSYSLLTRHRGIVTRVNCGRHGKQEPARENLPITKLVDARKRARDALAGIEQGIDPREEKRKASEALPDAIESVVEDFVRLYKGRRKKAISERTKDENARVLRERLVPHFKGRSITTIKRRELIEFLEEMGEEAPALAHRTQALLATLFDWATDREILEISPAVRLRAANKPESRDRALKDAEIKLLWPVFEAQGNPFGPFFKMCLLTAARRTEVATMKWEDIDSGLWKLSNTKTGVPRDIPLSTTALDILSDIPRQGEYVFTSSGKKPISGFSKAKKAIELKSDVDPWTIHDLRRTAATHMAELKTPRIVVMAVLGHSDSTVTATYDRHDYLEEKTHALQMWADKIERLTGGAPSNVTSLAEVRA